MNILPLLKTIIFSFLASLFAGLIIFSIGFGAMFPTVHFPGLWLAERELATEINLLTQNYSYKPGQSGTTIRYLFTNSEGKERDVSLRVITYSGLAYALFFDLLAFLAAASKQFLPSKTTLTFFERWTTYALGIALIVSFGSMAVLVITVFFNLFLMLVNAW